jgi:hypothetical protein
MIASPTVALDLPLKALAWQDAEGGAWLSYNEVGLLHERHGGRGAARGGGGPVGRILRHARRSCDLALPGARAGGVAR